jgi:hypothetical protein
VSIASRPAAIVRGMERRRIGFLEKLNPDSMPRTKAVAALVWAVIFCGINFVLDLFSEPFRLGNDGPLIDHFGWWSYVWMAFGGAVSGAVIDHQTPPDDELRLMATQQRLEVGERSVQSELGREYSQ